MVSAEVASLSSEQSTDGEVRWYDGTKSMRYGD
jgi:hypothetical protein